MPVTLTSSRRIASVVAACAAAMVLVGCNWSADATPGDTAPDAATSGAPRSSSGSEFELPPTAGVFDYQLGGPSDVVSTGNGKLRPDVVVRDASAPALPGAYSVCYVNGFQTQPDEAAAWRADRAHLLLTDADGVPVHDPAWPDEDVLDPSTASQREGILGVIGPVIDACARAGYAAVEIDNLDTWTRFDRIDRAGALELARAYVDRAHANGLAIAQKNAAEVTEIAHDELGFDFAVVEECGAYEECERFTSVYGPHVLQIEYPDSLAEGGTDFARVCASPDRAPLTILRDRDLVASGDGDHVYERCV